MVLSGYGAGTLTDPRLAVRPRRRRAEGHERAPHRGDLPRSRVPAGACRDASGGLKHLHLVNDGQAQGLGCGLEPGNFKTIQRRFVGRVGIT